MKASGSSGSSARNHLHQPGNDNDSFVRSFTTVIWYLGQTRSMNKGQTLLKKSIGHAMVLFLVYLNI